MNIHDFLIPPAESARRKGPHDRIVMSSRVRLARNVKEAAFPGWAKKPERVRVLDLIRPAVESLPEMKDAFSESMDSLTSLDKQILVERHLISREHAAKSAGSCAPRRCTTVYMATPRLGCAMCTSISWSRPFSTLNSSAISQVHGEVGPAVMTRPSERV